MATFEESAAPTVSAQEFYTWTFPGAPVRIHLHLNVVESLGREIRRAFESVPSHSVEIGGILYGMADFAASRTVEIKDFEPLLCEYRADHKFILSESDRRKLDRLLAARRADGDGALSVVGYYRAHIGEGLGLRADDLAVAQSHFFDPANVFLLVKPAADGSATAGFFFWDNGRIDSEFTFLEFPFDSRQLTGLRAASAAQASMPSIVQAEQSVEPQTQPEYAPPTPPEEYYTPLDQDRLRPQPAKRKLSAWRVVLLTLVMFALGAAGYQGYLAWMPQRADQPASDAPALSLQVERKGSDLRVNWNRNAPAVRLAVSGVLTIRDGDAQQQDLQLDTEQLRSGSVTYTPANSPVRFRLEITGPNNTRSSETVLALMAARPATPGTPPVPAVGPPPQPDAAAANSTGAPKNSGEPLRVTMLDAPAQPPAETHPNKRPGGASGLYLPPRPMRQVQPTLSPRVRRLIAAPVQVSVKVWISSTGVVTKAEPQLSGQVVSSSLVAAAQQAALRWRFAPAVSGTETVPSELILNFQYRPVAH